MTLLHVITTCVVFLFVFIVHSMTDPGSPIKKKNTICSFHMNSKQMTVSQVSTGNLPEKTTTNFLQCMFASL